MAVDNRERILLRLKELLVALAGDDIFVWRNRSEFDEKELPAYVLLDANEGQGVRSTDRRGPQIMSLEPEIYYLPKPTENQLNVGVGEDLSAKRMAIIKAIMQDGQLKDILGDNGYAEYRGMETDMQAAGDVKGMFRMNFAFAYVFNFNKL